MEQTDVKNKKITRRQIIMVVAFLAVIIILAVVLWPKPVQQRQHVYFIVQDARVDFYWDSRTVGAGIAAKTITYQYDGGVHFPDITIYDEQTGDVLARKRGIEVDTKKFTIEADVSGVEYVRIEFNANNPGFGGKMLVKDACLY